MQAADAPDAPACLGDGLPACLPALTRFGAGTLLLLPCS